MLQHLMRPIARALAAVGVTANQVTGTALLGSITTGLLLATVAPARPTLWLLMPLWMLLRMALNALDGLLAREHGHRSALGAYANELADGISDAAVLLPLATLPGFHAEAVVAITLLAGWTELGGVLGPTIGASRRFDGPMGKADRALVLGLIGVWTALVGPLPAVAWLEGAWVLLLVVTLLRRIRAGLAEAR
jgi:CDP-diacylglycerol--glycerol-3-phosphate 3-phosphatidyltransferase